tara:strand:- start:442 stop:2808 length:2367 start_codon:yes stop_codon:yes gene_type:complete
MAQQLIFEPVGLFSSDQYNKFRIKMSNGEEMTVNNEGRFIIQAVNINGGIQISDDFKYSLGFGIQNFDYSRLFEIRGVNLGNGLGSVDDYTTLPYSGEISESDFMAQFNVRNIYWEVENYSCIVELLITRSSNFGDTYDDVYGGGSEQNVFGSSISGHKGITDLGTFGFEQGTATFLGNLSHNYLRRIPKAHVDFNILVNFYLRIGGLKIYPLTSTIHNENVLNNTYFPVNFTDFAPNLKVNIEELNYPDFVLERDSIPIFLKLKSDNYRGKFQVYLIDKTGFEQDLYSDIQTLIPNYGDTLGSQYGELFIDNTTNKFVEYDIVDNQEINVPITYTPNPVNTGQTDTVAFLIKFHDIDLSLYGDNVSVAEAEIVYNSEGEQNHVTYKDDIKIQIINNTDEYYDNYLPSNTLIEKPTDVIHHLMFEELNIDIDNVDLDSKNIVKKEHQDWKLAFSQDKKISAKSLIANLANSSKFFPILNNDVLKFVNLKSSYRGGSQFYEDGTIENISTIKESEVLEYNFSRTPINNIVTELDFKYNKDYGLNNYKNSVHLLVNKDNYLKNGIYKNILDNNIELNNYYGVKINENDEIVHNKTKKVVENDYVRDKYTADLLAEYIFQYYKNQHNVVELKLPLKYYNYEVGDIFEFDKMILGRKLYNEHYVINDIEDMPIRCGQFILPLFIVTETRKNLNNITIKGEQLHHLLSSPLNWKGQELTLQSPQDSDVPEILLGDVNNDGRVDVLDVVAIVNHIVGENILSAEQVTIADTNQDGSLDVLDLVEITARIVNEEN